MNYYPISRVARNSVVCYSPRRNGIYLPVRTLLCCRVSCCRVTHTVHRSTHSTPPRRAEISCRALCRRAAQSNKKKTISSRVSLSSIRPLRAGCGGSRQQQHKAKQQPSTAQQCRVATCKPRRSDEKSHSLDAWVRRRALESPHYNSTNSVHPLHSWHSLNSPHLTTRAQAGLY